MGGRGGGEREGWRWEGGGGEREGRRWEGGVEVGGRGGGGR